MCIAVTFFRVNETGECRKITQAMVMVWMLTDVYTRGNVAFWMNPVPPSSQKMKATGSSEKLIIFLPQNMVS